MRNVFLLGAAVAALSLSGAANAATCGLSGGVETCFFTAGLDPEFSTTFHPDGTISAGLHHDGIGNYDFRDIFYFYVPDNSGVGSGGVLTTASSITTDLDFTSLDIYTGSFFDGTNFIGGTHYNYPNTSTGIIESIGASGIPITQLEDNYIVISGVSRGNGSYGGNATFTPVPEPATWAMMLFGFGAVGFGMRRRKKQETRVRFAF